MPRLAPGRLTGWTLALPLALAAFLLATPAPASAEGLEIAEGVEFYPFPTYKGNRDEGDTFGGVGVFLVTNKKHEIIHVIAPLAQYNTHTGVSGGLLAFGYPTDHQEYKVVATVSDNVDREVRLKYSDKKLLDGKYSASAQVKWFIDGFSRFYGFGPESELANESNFASKELSFGATFGFNLSDNLTVGVGERYRDIELERGTVTTLPFTGDRFPEARGTDGATLLGHRFWAGYDTRDNGQTPTRGLMLGAEVEFCTGLAGDVPTLYEKWTLEGRKFFPHGDDTQYVFVARVKLDFTSGAAAPFYEQASLGGSDSLRAFGGDRWIDRHAWLINLEERIRLWRTEIFGHPMELEIAPHVDLGQIYSGTDMFSNVQVNPGATLRLLSRPNVVGGITTSYGSEGLNVFGGFSFPF
ncbi:MAG: BamA/TamA family outer membrane protein [Planctomycetes bacterium]|nr:BamA/TamA family outer membrane protein [Planctomycetota bacterium]